VRSSFILAYLLILDPYNQTTKICQGAAAVEQRIPDEKMLGKKLLRGLLTLRSTSLNLEPRFSPKEHLDAETGFLIDTSYSPYILQARRALSRRLFLESRAHKWLELRLEKYKFGQMEYPPQSL